MRRLEIKPRPDWIQKAEKIGFTYHTLGEMPGEVDGVYWYESAAYEFTADEIDALESATENLHQLCLAAVDHVCARPELMHAFRIPAPFRDLVVQSWTRRDMHWMGRFDLAFNPESGSVKMLEYNADTPTLVIETALMQWFWMQDKFSGEDQFNSLHEKLLDRLKELKKRLPSGERMHFSALETCPEEYMHAMYFMDLAHQAGIEAAFLPIDRIGYHPDIGFVDEERRAITLLHKLYPWEWMVQDSFGRFISKARTTFIEPPWKMLLSNKALLPLLWEMFPNHPNLLAAGWTPESAGSSYITKPILGREGANMCVIRPGRPDIITEGTYASDYQVYQEFCPLPKFDDQHVVIGSWVVGDAAAGMIIRESEGPIIVNTSRVVPHYFLKRPEGNE
jgi:glutathionylspermidine synthase